VCIRNLKIGKVLVVDDTEDIRELMERLLISRGYKVFSTPNGESALTEIARALHADEPYDAVLLDYAMPDMDGLTCALKIRENEAAEENCAHVRIGFVTGHPDLRLNSHLLQNIGAKQTDKIKVVEKLANLEEWLQPDKCQDCAMAA